MFYLTAFRLAFIYLFRSKMDQASSASDIAKAAMNGMRFDSVIVTYLLLIPLILAIVPRFQNLDGAAARAGEAFGRGFIWLTSLFWIVTVGYFREFDQQFNLYFFNLYYDDTKAILLTIWSGYHPLIALAVISVVSWAMIALSKKLLPAGDAILLRLAKKEFSTLRKIVIGMMSLLLVALASRGTFDARPLEPQDIGVVTDPFLNKAVLNPYYSLLYAVQDHMVQTRSRGLAVYLPDGNIRRAVRELFPAAKDPNNLDSYLEKHAKGPKGTLPRHIFLILMESYDSWPLLPRYASLGLTTQLTALGKEGIYFDRFLPSSMATSEAFCVLVTSLPYPDLKVNYQYSVRKTFPSSLFAAFKRLGYRTRLFYGGYLTWQRFGDFAQDQGVEEVYGAPNMNKGLVTHDWGIDDEYLFDFVQKTVTDDRPSFNFILTTSYHEPFDVDVYAAGFPLRKIPDNLAASFDGSMSLKALGHIWYGDKCLGSFTRTMEKKLTRPLFAFTGDHYSRRFINAKPDYFEQSGVPFILYGKEVLKNIRVPKDSVGSQLDIGSTLIELAAPKGFTYYAAGQDLLAPRKEQLGIGYWRLIGKDFLFDVHGQKFQPLPGRELPKDLPDINHLKNIFYDIHGIGWWRVVKGADLP
jgi:phosphoglycerol transferase MdoB-like AlkP superfamily enzyme